MVIFLFFQMTVRIQVHAIQSSSMEADIQVLDESHCDVSVNDINDTL